MRGMDEGKGIAMGLFNMLFGSKKQTHKVRYKRYSEAIDLTGRDVLSVFTRADAIKLFPFLAEPATMSQRDIDADALTVEMTGVVPDEVHEFENARQGGMRLMRLLLKGDKVIYLSHGEWERHYPPLVK